MPEILTPKAVAKIRATLYDTPAGMEDKELITLCDSHLAQGELLAKAQAAVRALAAAGNLLVSKYVKNPDTPHEFISMLSGGGKTSSYWTPLRKALALPAVQQAMKEQPCWPRLWRSLT